MKPILIGTDNPHSADPAMALVPYIVGTTGWRLWKMLSDARPAVTWRDYIDAFQRSNMLDLPVLERSCGQAFLPGQLVKMLQRAPAVVLLGDAVRRHFGLPKVFLHPVIHEAVTYRQIPHPSGRNLFYNDPAMRALVGQLLAELYDESVRSQRKSSGRKKPSVSTRSLTRE